MKRIYLHIIRRCFQVARRCEVCNKGVVSGTQYSHSHRQSKRTWAPNIKRVKALVNGTPKTVHVCTRCLRSGKVERAI
nr:50S ribosomal protein L28 [Clostridium sp. NSJ-145]